MRAFVALHAAVDELAGSRISREDLDAELDAMSNADIKRALGMEMGAPGSAERRAWRTMDRNLQRYRKGRNPGPRITRILRDRLASRGLRATLERIRRRGISVDYAGVVIVSDDERYRAPGPVWIERGEALDRMVDEALDGRWGRAADHLADAWGQGYGIGAVGWGDVDQLDLAWDR